MIELYTGNFLVEENGRQLSLDLERLHTDVRNAGETAGVAGAWLADHALWAVEDYFHARRRQAGNGAPPPPPRREEVDRAVARVLTDAGYADVAAAFTRRRSGTGPGGDDETGPAGQTPWDSTRLGAVLEELAPLSRERLKLLVHRVEAALLKLSLPRVTDDLIRHLGMNLQTSGPAPAAAAVVPPRESPWLLGPEFWRDRLPPEACGNGSGRPWLIPHPVSRLSPAVRVTFDLAGLFPGRTGTPPLTELLFWPRLSQAVAGLRTVTAAMQRELLAAVPAANGRPVRVDVRGLPSITAALHLDKVPSRARRLEAELRLFLQKQLSDLDGTPVMTQFTNEGRAA
ncbi:MAG: hypothetical protein WC708_16105 [Lentisphaeria bacterium]